MGELTTQALLGWTAAYTTPFILVFFAEFGDKSQLVCMALAARHSPWPVLAGSGLAFALLNALAVVFGAGLAHWLPERLLAGAVGILFALFGLWMLIAEADQEAGRDVAERGGSGIFITTFLMILLAEMGDKTQIAVAGMASTLPAIPVWTGATLALISTSALGIIAGRRLVGRVPLRRIHQISGVLFLILAAFAFYKALT